MTLSYVSNDMGLAARLDWALGIPIVGAAEKLALAMLAAHGQTEAIALEDLARRIPASAQRTRELLESLQGRGLIELRTAPATWIEYSLKGPA